MVLAGPAPQTDFETALELVRFSNSSDTPDTTPRDITVVANDGEGDGPVAHATITVVPANDAPVNTVPGAQSAIPNTDKAIAGLAVSDIDAASGSLTTTLSVLHGILTVACGGRRGSVRQRHGLGHAHRHAVADQHDALGVQQCRLQERPELQWQRHPHRPHQ